MGLRFEESDGMVVVRVDETELGADQADSIRSELLQKLDECPWAALDLSTVTFMDSSALGVVVAGLKAVRGIGEVRLFGVQDRVDELFRLTGLSRVFSCDATEEESITQLRGTRSQARSA